MIPKKYAPMLFGLVLSGLMSLLVSGISTLRATGGGTGFLGIWVGAWLTAWAIAFPVVLLLAPVEFDAGINALDELAGLDGGERGGALGPEDLEGTLRRAAGLQSGVEENGASAVELEHGEVVVAQGVIELEGHTQQQVAKSYAEHQRRHHPVRIDLQILGAQLVALEDQAELDGVPVQRAQRLEPVVLERLPAGAPAARGRRGTQEIRDQCAGRGGPRL